MEGDAKDESETMSVSAEQNIGPESGSEPTRVELKPSAPLEGSKADDSGSENGDESSTPRPEGEFGVTGSKRVIEPSSEFKSEMTQDSEGQIAGQPGSEASPADQEASADDSSTGESNGSSDSAEHHETPTAVKDFIDSEVPQNSEQVANSAELSAQPEVEPITQPSAQATQVPEGQLSSSNLSPVDPQDGTTPPGAVSFGSAVAGAATATDGTQPGSQAAEGSSKHGLIWAIIAAVVIVIGILAFVFLYYLPNRPGAVFDSSMDRTGQAIDKLVSYSQDNYLADFQSFGLKGNVTVNGKNYNFASDLNGSYDKSGNSTTDLNVNSKTEGNSNTNFKAALSLKTIKPDGQSYPDVYFKVSGISDLLDQLGASSFDQYDGKWIVVSHDLIKNYLDSTAGSGADVKSPTKAQIFDAINKAQIVNKEYLFTSDQSKAVIVNKQYLQAETKFGRSTYHYIAAFNKAHMLAYVDALKTALNGSSLNSWAKANLKHDLVQQSDVKDTKAAINKIKDSTTFDLWADRSTKLIEAVQFTTTKDSVKTVVTLAQTYDGGDDYPFKLIVSGSDNQSKGGLEMNFSINAKSHEAKLDFAFNNNENGDKTTANGSFTISPSDKKLKLTKPADAESIESLLQELGIGSDAQPGNDSFGYSGAQQKAKDADMESIAAQVRNKLGEYYADHSTYPKDTQALDDWLLTAEGGSNVDLASRFTSANGFSYTADNTSFVIKFVLSDGSVSEVTN